MTPLTCPECGTTYWYDSDYVPDGSERCDECDCALEYDESADDAMSDFV